MIKNCLKQLGAFSLSFSMELSHLVQETSQAQQCLFLVTQTPPWPTRSQSTSISHNYSGYLVIEYNSSDLCVFQDEVVFFKHSRFSYDHTRNGYYLNLGTELSYIMYFTKESVALKHNTLRGCLQLLESCVRSASIMG